MGILDRISTILRSNINSALDKAEDPEKMLDQIIRDMGNAIEEAKGQVALVIAQEKQIEAERSNTQKQQQQWADRAEKAVRAGRDDLATEALRRKRDLDNIIATYSQQYEAQHQMSSKLRGQLDLLQNKYDDAVRNRDVMIARHRQALASQKINKQIAAISGLDHSSELARMDQRIRQEEALAAAHEELQSSTSSVEDQFRMLEAHDNVDEDLKQLKARMGMGGTGQPGQ
jgi:phage shock protein A